MQKQNIKEISFLWEKVAVMNEEPSHYADEIKCIQFREGRLVYQRFRTILEEQKGLEYFNN